MSSEAFSVMLMGLNAAANHKLTGYYNATETAI
jgi:hypothetical protein